MTLDELASEMRRRFTSSQGQAVEITAEEWTVMADAIHLRDALVDVVGNPTSDTVRAKVATLLKKHGRV